MEFILALVFGLVFLVLLFATILGESKLATGLGAAGALVGAIIFLIASLNYSVGPGQAVVIKNWTGSIAGHESAADLHGRAPWQDVIYFNTRNQRVVFVNPKTSTGDNAGGTADGREIAVTDVDGVTSNVDITVVYNLDPSKIESIYTNYRDEDSLKSTLIYNDIRSVVRTEAGKLHTLELLTDRNKLSKAVQDELSSRWADKGVLVDTVDTQQIDPPDTVKTAFDEAQKSQIEVQKATNDLAAAKVAAQQRVVQAQAQADANNLLTASLSPQVLENKYLDALKAGTVYVVPAGTTPFITAK